MMARLLIACLSLWLASGAQAGVTIHFEASAKSTGDVSRVLEIATAYAKERGWKVEQTFAAAGELPGIVLYPHIWSEPVWLRFANDLALRDSVKTQFAGADVHVEIIRLFDVLKPIFKSLDIVDEGEYWEKRDRALLENHLNQVKESLRQLKREEPAMYGPIKLKDGRIVDMIR
jgi:hypothetical protein